MRVAKRLQIAAAAFVSVLALSQAASAASLKPLSDDDATRYAAAFAAASQGDFIAAQMNMVELRDRSLEGYIAYDQLMHPTAHKASFEELTGWLGKFRDLPLAERIFGLALRRRPAEALTPPAPELAGYGARASTSAVASDSNRRAREAFFDGDVKRALRLATAAQDRWMIGMAAYRLASFAQAHAAFRDLSQDTAEDAWVRSAAAFWASRAAGALGDAALALEELKLAAAAPQTFYGMIAAQQLRDRPDASVKLTSASPVRNDGEAMQLMSANPRAHRAAALAQIGRLPEAATELHAGFALARDAADRDRWAALALALGAPAAAVAAPLLTGQAEDYPTPDLAPKSGFTLDRALVYAIVRQESRFNPQAVSHKGAVGLMQLTPDAAARAAGDDKLKSDMSPLFDPAFNLRVGQDYFAWLMDRNVGYDLLRAVAAYNGGPGMVQRAADLLGSEAADPLMLMECLPAAETRNYVQKVLAGYWIYKARFGEKAPSLDAIARGDRVIDARLDLTQPSHPTQLSGELLQSALR